MFNKLPVRSYNELYVNVQWISLWLFSWCRWQPAHKRLRSETHTHTDTLQHINTARIINMLNASFSLSVSLYRCRNRRVRLRHCFDQDLIFISNLNPFWILIAFWWVTARRRCGDSCIECESNMQPRFADGKPMKKIMVYLHTVLNVWRCLRRRLDNSPRCPIWNGMANTFSDCLVMDARHRLMVCHVIPSGIRFRAIDNNH